MDYNARGNVHGQGLSVALEIGRTEHDILDGGTIERSGCRTADDLRTERIVIIDILFVSIGGYPCSHDQDMSVGHYSGGTVSVGGPAGTRGQIDIVDHRVPS